MKHIKTAMIAAQGLDREIGFQNKLLWHISDDLKYFKRVTMGKPIVMGRKTYESIGRPLPGRLNIVVSRGGFAAEGVEVFDCLEGAVKRAKEEAVEKALDEVIIMGGAQIYAQGMDLADRIYLTQVEARFEADTYFPEIVAPWSEVWREEHLDAELPYSFLRFEAQR